MGPANGRDVRGVARHREPVVNGGPDLASLDRRLARPVVTCDEQDEAVSCLSGALER
jgi:hypothetical protein